MDVFSTENTRNISLELCGLFIRVFFLTAFEIFPKEYTITFFIFKGNEVSLKEINFFKELETI